MAKRFKRLFKVAGGHTYWQDTDAGMVAITDDSGPTPDKTDDGVLWLDTSKHIEVIRAGLGGGSHFCVPLLRPASRTSSTLASPDEVRMLVQRFGMKIDLDGMVLSGPVAG